MNAATFTRGATDVLRTLFGPEPTILDLGANRGDSVADWLETFSDARVHAFEPDPTVAQTLGDRFADNPRVRVYAAAAGARNGTARFTVCADPRFSSLLDPAQGSGEFYGSGIQAETTRDVPVIRLDDWAQREGVGRVDLLKIDVQGAELDVLKGATQLLTRTRAIKCEAQLFPAYAGAATLDSLGPWFRERGFHLYRVCELWSLGLDERPACIDGLWLDQASVRFLAGRPRT